MELTVFAKKKVSLNEQNISTIIGEGCIINGDINSKDYVRIDGTIEGKVVVDQGLVVGEKGVINGNVKTQELIVYGTINGDVQSQKLELKSSGKIKGSISTQKIQMDLGSVYNGQLAMYTEEVKGEIKDEHIVSIRQALPSKAKEETNEQGSIENDKMQSHT